jgi:hypothetical protein
MTPAQRTLRILTPFPGLRPEVLMYLEGRIRLEIEEAVEAEKLRCLEIATRVHREAERDYCSMEAEGLDPDVTWYESGKEAAAREILLEIKGEETT